MPPRPILKYHPVHVHARIGGSLDLDAISRTNEALKDATPLPMYTTEEHSTSAWIALYDNDGAARRLIGLWIQDPGNLSRAYHYFDRRVPPMRKPGDLHASYVRAWVIFRIRVNWMQVHMNGISGDPGIWVLIPLETWTRNNGLPFQVVREIPVGQDLTIDGKEQLTFIGAGGCTVICFSLV